MLLFLLLLLMLLAIEFIKIVTKTSVKFFASQKGFLSLFKKNYIWCLNVIQTLFFIFVLELFEDVFFSCEQSELLKHRLHFRSWQQKIIRKRTYWFQLRTKESALLHIQGSPWIDITCQGWLSCSSFALSLIYTHTHKKKNRAEKRSKYKKWIWSKNMTFFCLFYIFLPTKCHITFILLISFFLFFLLLH